MEKEISAVDNVLDALNQIAIVSDMTDLRKANVDNLLQKPSLNFWLKEFSNIYKNCRNQSPTNIGNFGGNKQVVTQASTLADTLKTDLETFPQLNMSPNAQELHKILDGSSHLKTLLKVYDLAVSDWKNVQEAASLAQMQTGVRSDGSNQNSNATPDNHQQNLQNSQNQTTIRLIQFHKHNNEPLGITLKMTPEGHCVIARVFHGGLIHRQGTLHAGDQIREINNIEVSNKSIEQLQMILKELKGAISFKVIPGVNSNMNGVEPVANSGAKVTPGLPTAISPTHDGVANGETNNNTNSNLPKTFIKCLFDYDQGFW